MRGRRFSFPDELSLLAWKNKANVLFLGIPLQLFRSRVIARFKNKSLTCAYEEARPVNLDN